MKKDKEWLKNEINKVTSRIYGADFSTLKETDDLIDQLEPELTQDQVDKYLHERNLVAVDEMTIHQTGMQNKVVVEKPVIPESMAELIEKLQGRGFSLGRAIGSVKALDYFTQKLYGNLFYNTEDERLFARAWLDGYEVEKEKKYYVADSDDGCILYRNTDTKYDKRVAYPEEGRLLKHIIAHNEEHLYQFTEKEIKDYDERYWPFAQEVTQ